MPVTPEDVEVFKKNCRIITKSCRYKKVCELDSDDKFSLAFVAGCKVHAVPGKTDDSYFLQAVNLIKLNKIETGFEVIEQIGTVNHIHIIDFNKEFND